MKREAQSVLSVDGQQALDHFSNIVEDLSAMTVCNYLSDLRQFRVWCEYSWHKEQDERSFTPQRTVPPPLIRYRTYLQTTLWLKPSSINRALMRLKYYFAWVVRAQLTGDDPTITVKFVPKEATAPRHLEDALVAAVNTDGTLRDRTIITLLLHTGLRAEELCHLPCKQVHVGKRDGTLHIISKRKKGRSVPLDTTACVSLEVSRNAATGKDVSFSLRKNWKCTY